MKVFLQITILFVATTAAPALHAQEISTVHALQAMDVAGVLKSIYIQETVKPKYRQEAMVFYDLHNMWVHYAFIDPDELFKDSDNDGVIDRLDKEPDTPEGIPVNVHGVSLDTDANGIYDSLVQDLLLMRSYYSDSTMWLAEWVKAFEPYVYHTYQMQSLNIEMPMIFFQLHSAALDVAAIPPLQYLAALLKAYPCLQVNITVYAQSNELLADGAGIIWSRQVSILHFLEQQNIDLEKCSVGYSNEYLYHYEPERENGLDRSATFALERCWSK
ncbi:MAG: hypothetical protein R2794_10715 [Chitinophagales bacterium]